MHRAAVGRPCSLQVGEEGLADVAEGEALGVGERVDRRVLAPARALPLAEQERDRVEGGMEFGSVHDGEEAVGTGAALKG